MFLLVIATLDLLLSSSNLLLISFVFKFITRPVITAGKITLKLPTRANACVYVRVCVLSA